MGENETTVVSENKTPTMLSRSKAKVVSEKEAVVYKVIGGNKVVCSFKPGVAGILLLDVSLTSILRDCLADVNERNPATVILQEPVVWSVEDKAFRCERMLRVGESWIRNMKRRPSSA